MRRLHAKSLEYRLAPSPQPDDCSPSLPDSPGTGALATEPPDYPKGGHLTLKRQVRPDGSSKRQQPHRPRVAAINRHQPSDVRR